MKREIDEIVDNMWNMRGVREREGGLREEVNGGVDEVKEMCEGVVGYWKSI
ncbi:hypothetical protein [Bacillus pumilus]|uniref:hypothetical protein n=1 Tax=Bacillus pumilus TaxID=1408 RepID=UPI0016427F22|nr:hypothetical protein [Bacillus pumilus]